MLKVMVLPLGLLDGFVDGFFDEVLSGVGVGEWQRPSTSHGKAVARRMARQSMSASSHSIPTF